MREKAFPRAQRQKISQEQYLKTVSIAIGGLSSITRHLKPLNEKAIKTLSLKSFYTLQNICELIATIMNPNSEYALLSEKTIIAVRKQHAEAESWLRSLGESRIEAMHINGIISARDLATHIKYLQLFKSEVLLKEGFQREISSSNLINTSRGLGTLFSSVTAPLDRGSGSISSIDLGDNASTLPQPGDRSRDESG